VRRLVQWFPEWVYVPNLTRALIWDCEILILEVRNLERMEWQ
jgi:hypothetical protein